MKLTLRRVRDGYQQVGRIAREIVAVRVTVLAGVGIIGGELVRDGVIPDGLADSVTHWSTVTFAVLGVVTGVLWARQGTTPADPQLQPKDKYGNDLVSALDVGPHDGLGDVIAGLPADGPSAADALAAAAALQPTDPASP